MLNLTPTKYHWNARSDALWFATEPGQSSGKQTFDTLYDAVEFVTMRLKPTTTTAVQIFPERGEPLHDIPQINDAWTAIGPPMADAETSRSLAFEAVLKGMRQPYGRHIG